MILPDSICQHMLKLRETASAMVVQRNSYIYLENNPADTVYMLEQGSVMLTKLLPDGHEVGIILLTGHNLFAHCEVISGTKREHQARALTTCKLWTVNAQTFLHETRTSCE